MDWPIVVAECMFGPPVSCMNSRMKSYLCIGFASIVSVFMHLFQIRAELDEARVDYSDVRMVRHKDTGG